MEVGHHQAKRADWADDHWSDSHIDRLVRPGIPDGCVDLQLERCIGWPVRHKALQPEHEWVTPFHIHGCLGIFYFGRRFDEVRVEHPGDQYGRQCEQCQCNVLLEDVLRGYGRAVGTLKFDGIEHRDAEADAELGYGDGHDRWHEYGECCWGELLRSQCR